jgi:Leucine-rich repeat (LRR) protein
VRSERHYPAGLSFFPNAFCLTSVSLTVAVVHLICSAAIAHDEPKTDAARVSEITAQVLFDPGVLVAQEVIAADGKPVADADLDQAHAIQKLETFGCIVYPYDGAPADAVTRVSFRWGSAFWDENTPLLQVFPNLTTIDFSNTSVCGTRIVNAGLKRLRTLKKLTTLNFNTTGIGDDGLREIARCKSLTALFLRNTQISDAGLKQLTDVTNLSELDVSGTRITDTGLKELVRLTKLRTLLLSRNQVTNETLRRLHHSLPDLHISLRDDF